MEFRGCNIRFENCRRLVVRNCRFRYPSTPRIFPDGKTAIELQRNLRVTGEDNVLERLLIEWAVDGSTLMVSRNLGKDWSFAEWGFPDIG